MSTSTPSSPEITLFSILPSTSSPTMSANNPPHSLHTTPSPPFSPQQLQTIHALSFPPSQVNLTSKHVFCLTTAENKRWYGYCLTVPWIEERIQGYPLVNCRDDFSRRPTPGEEKNLRRSYIIISPSPSAQSTFFPLLSTLPFLPKPLSLMPEVNKEERLLPLFMALDSSSYTLLLTSLMLERRVIVFGEESPSREVISLLHVLSLFKLNYRGLFLPTLPTNLTDFVHAPTPYLIAVPTSLALTFQSNPDIKDVIYVNVDTKTVYGNCLNITACLPPPDGNSQKQPPTFVDRLIQAFDSISKGFLKDASRGGMQEGVKAVGKQVGKIKGWMNTKIQRRGSGMMSNPLPNPQPATIQKPPGPVFHNPRREVELRQCLVSFFGYLLSDARLFTRRVGTGFQLDKQNWVEAMKRKSGRNVGMGEFCEEFANTRMFIDHCDERVAAFGKDSPEASLSSMILKCGSCEFSDIYKAIQPHFKVPVQDPIKDLALKLTSNSTYKGHYFLSLDKVVNNLNESVWDVIWDRLEDSKTFNWKHGYLGLQMLKAVMISVGPATVERVWERLEVVRRLMSYGGGISGQGKSIEKEARDVFRLASDLNYLRARRDHKRIEDTTTYRWKGESLGLDGKVKMISGTAGFKALHSIVAPKGFKSRGPLPENDKFTAAAETVVDSRVAKPVDEVADQIDLLDFGFSGSGDTPANPFDSPTATTTTAPATNPATGSGSLGLKRPSIGPVGMPPPPPPSAMTPPMSSAPVPAGAKSPMSTMGGTPGASPLRRPTAMAGFGDDPFASVAVTNTTQMASPARNNFSEFSSNSGGPSFQQQQFSAAPSFSPPHFPQPSPPPQRVNNSGFAASNGFDAFNSNSGGPGFSAAFPATTVNISSPPLHTVPQTMVMGTPSGMPGMQPTAAAQSPFGNPTAGGAHMNISMMHSVVNTEEKKKKEEKDDPFAQFAQF
ncbi:hypothetical protein TrST_g10609 [Triparma strigata]|uniref:UDENN domain-containing protein n=1 Tax=Triparma strigata TaxID=1606541 RepID=A0A9W7EIF9_9STRA|nr:hypothetical protein TrST_g10609 [Triparma strigata]